VQTRWERVAPRHLFLGASPFHTLFCCVFKRELPAFEKNVILLENPSAVASVQRA